MATVDGNSLLFLRNDRQVSRSTLWAARALIGLMLLVWLTNMVGALTQNAGYAFGSAVGGLGMIALVYWVALRLTSSAPE